MLVVALGFPTLAGIAEAGPGRWSLSHLTVPTYIQSLTIAPNGDVYVGFNSVQHPMPSDVSVSHDGGISWVSLPHPGNDTYALVIAVAATTPPTIFVGNGSSVIDRSLDGGSTWDHVGPSIGANLSTIAIDPSHPNRVYAAFNGECYGSGSDSLGYFEAGLFVSDDRGDSWDAVAPDVFTTGMTSLSIDPLDQTIVGSTRFGVFLSKDSGATWAQASQLMCYVPNVFPPSCGDLSRVLTIGGDHAIYAYSQWTLEQSGCNGTEVSDNMGATWSLLSPPPNHMIFDIAVDPVNPKVLLANCGISTLISKDGGTSWREFADGNYFYIVAFSLDGKTIYGVSDSGIFTCSFQGITPVPTPAAPMVRRR
jgi:hypothetical protein